jgi:uncharacterized protein YjbI with pentapeptide repeats
VNNVALSAIAELSQSGWLYDGSLQGACLSGANWRSANMRDANLQALLVA